MFRPDTLMNALDTVLAWELPEESFSAALADRANLLAGGDPEQIDRICSL